LYEFPLAPEGAGFRPHGLLWFPPMSEDIGFRQGGAQVSASSRRCWFPSARVALVFTSARRHWFPPGRVQGFPPLSEDAGFRPCGVHRRPLPSEDGGFFLYGANASARVRGLGFVRRRACLLRDDVAAEAAAPMDSRAEAFMSGRTLRITGAGKPAPSTIIHPSGRGQWSGFRKSGSISRDISVRGRMTPTIPAPKHRGRDAHPKERDRVRRY
jgi:hypothetical protein